MLGATDNYAMNTFLIKSADRLLTSRDNKTPEGPDGWSWSKFARSGFASANNKSRNASNSMGTDTNAKLNSDHLPVIVDMQIK